MTLHRSHLPPESYNNNINNNNNKSLFQGKKFETWNVFMLRFPESFRFQIYLKLI